MFRVKSYTEIIATKDITFDEVTYFFNKRLYDMKKRHDATTFAYDLKVYNDVKMCVYKIIMLFEDSDTPYFLNEEGDRIFMDYYNIHYICKECNKYKRNIMVPITIENDPAYMLMQIMIDYIASMHKTITYDDIHNMRNAFLNILTAIIYGDSELCLKRITRFMYKYFTFEKDGLVEFCMTDDNRLVSYVVRPPENPIYNMKFEDEIPYEYKLFMELKKNIKNKSNNKN